MPEGEEKIFGKIRDFFVKKLNPKHCFSVFWCAYEKFSSTAKKQEMCNIVRFVIFNVFFQFIITISMFLERHKLRYYNISFIIFELFLNGLGQ